MCRLWDHTVVKRRVFQADVTYLAQFQGEVVDAVNRVIGKVRQHIMYPIFLTYAIHVGNPD